MSRKLLAHMAPRPGAEEPLEARLLEVARELAEHGLEVASLWRLARDPFGTKTVWRGTLELRGPDSVLIGHADGLAARFGGCLDAPASIVSIGDEQALLPSERAPVRYQYLMRRRADFSHASYLKRYHEVHAQFGLRTPGILGYRQLHVDLPTSRRAADAAGFGPCDVDSVSELHLASLGEFLHAVAGSTIGTEAVADEERFVDRARSFDLCSRVTWHERSTA